MTAKEYKEEVINKADEIYNQMRFLFPKSSRVKLKTACLVMIGYIIKSTFKKETYDRWGITTQESLTTEFWIEVKQEIEKL